MTPDALDRETFKALREDAVRLDYLRLYAPPPQLFHEIRQMRLRHAIAEAFEHGNHLPDGTVLPTVRHNVGLCGTWPYPTISPEQARRLRGEIERGHCSD